MAPFMMREADGTQHVNLIRIVEQLVGAGISALIILYGGYVLLGERVDNATQTMQQHIRMDVENQRDMNKIMKDQSEALVRHETILRQQGLLK